MRCFLLFFTLICFITICFSQEKEVIVSVDGLVKNSMPGNSVIGIELKKINLATQTDSLIHTTSLGETGSFSFGKLRLQQGYYRVGYKGIKLSGSILLLVDEATRYAKFIIDTTHYVTKDEGLIGVFLKCTIEGNKANEKMDSFFAYTKQHFVEVETQMKEELNALLSQPNKTPEVDSLIARIGELTISFKEKKKIIVDKYLGTSIAVYQTMLEWDESDHTFIDKIVQKFKRDKHNSFITPLIAQRATELKNNNVVNRAAILFSLPNQNSDEVALSDFLGKQVILIQFWASWDPRSVREMQMWKHLYKKFSQKGFSIISVATATKSDLWKQSLEKQQFLWINVIDEGDPQSVASKYRLKFLPANILIDKNGVIIKKNVSYYDLEKYLLDHNQ